MPQIVEANLNAKGKKFGIISARFNDFIVGKLTDGAVDALVRSGQDHRHSDAPKATDQISLDHADDWSPGRATIWSASQDG